MDLIDRQMAIDAVYKCTDIYINNLPVMVDKADAYKALAALPSAQPEIIRCKHCRHRGRLECPLGITVFDAPKDDEFCSRAERRTE